jgi:enoyl-[acyl-carrier-protein] reductase (NADH)
MFSMKGKVVSITGGAGGIGFEVARAMAEAGADVAIWYVSYRILLTEGTIRPRKRLSALISSRRLTMSKQRPINVKSPKMLRFVRQLLLSSRTLER